MTTTRTAGSWGRGYTRGEGLGEVTATTRTTSTAGQGRGDGVGAGARGGDGDDDEERPGGVGGMGAVGEIFTSATLYSNTNGTGSWHQPVPMPAYGPG